MSATTASPGTASVATPPGVGATLDLRDIHLPGAPPLWPPAPGWWLLLVLLLIAAAAGALVALRRLRRVRRQRRILAELTRIGQRLKGPALIAAVAALLKRAARQRFGTGVAALTGPAWLDFLDRHGGDGGFGNGPGRVLAEGPYAPASADLDSAALLALAHTWLLRNT